MSDEGVGYSLAMGEGTLKPIIINKTISQILIKIQNPDAYF